MREQNDVEVLRLRLEGMAKTRLKLAGRIQGLIDELAETIGKYMEYCQGGYETCQDIMPEAAGTWWPKTRAAQVFGYLCERLHKRFPTEYLAPILPFALEIDYKPLTEIERQLLGPFLNE